MPDNPGVEFAVGAALCSAPEFGRVRAAVPRGVPAAAPVPGCLSSFSPLIPHLPELLPREGPIPAGMSTQLGSSPTELQTVLPSPTEFLGGGSSSRAGERSSDRRAQGMAALFVSPGQVPISRTRLCPLTPRNHSGNLGLGFSSFPGGAQSSPAGTVPWDLVPASTFVTEQLCAQNQL